MKDQTLDQAIAGLKADLKRLNEEIRTFEHWDFRGDRKRKTAGEQATPAVSSPSDSPGNQFPAS